MNHYSIHSRSLLILRASLSGIFLVAGINHLLFTENVTARLLASGANSLIVPDVLAPPLVTLSGVFMLIWGIALLLGFRTRMAAFGLILILIPITLTVQVGQWATVGPLFKNIVILGGLIFFALNGSVCCSIDSSGFFQTIFKILKK